jgi:hypothetical protein
MSPVRQHCAQCLTEILSNGVQTPTGETLCAECYAALWGPREKGDRLASNGHRPRAQRPLNGRSHWLGPTFEREVAVGSVSTQTPWRRRG